MTKNYFNQFSDNMTQTAYLGAGQWQFHKSVTNLRLIWGQTSSMDLTIFCSGGQEVKCHRAVLAMVRYGHRNHFYVHLFTIRLTRKSMIRYQSGPACKNKYQESVNVQSSNIRDIHLKRNFKSPIPFLQAFFHCFLFCQQMDFPDS